MEFVSEESTEEDKKYVKNIAFPKNEYCFQEEGEWTKGLSSGKVATILYTTDWKYGNCIVEITDEQRK